ncbi:MAG: AMP-binding protein [Myxococcota bacterium]
MNILKSTVPDVDIPEMNVAAYVLRHADRLGDKAAFIDGPSGRKVSYRELKTQVQSLAGGLQAKGVGPGTTWALMAPNLPEYAVVFMGLAWAGATVTTLNPTYGAEEVAMQLKDSQAKAIVTIGLFLEVAKAAAKEAGIEEVYVIGEGDAMPFTTLFGEPLADPVAVDPKNDVVVLPYSSGTTGFPKGVMLTHHNLVANLAQIDPHIPVSEKDTIFAVLPFFHIYGMVVIMGHTLSCGATAVTVPRFDMVQMLDLVQSLKINVMFLVPPIVLALAKHPVVEKYDMSSVRLIFSGAAPLSGELADAAATRVGCEVSQGYGMTELSPVSHAVRPNENKSGSVGTLLANTELRLVDPESSKDLVGTDEAGEVWIRGPQVMKGYFGQDSATASTIDNDGFLHTGDIGVVDSDGHLFIVDRLKELIKYKGFQVPPAELEALIVNMPGVADVAVIGIPDDEAGELPKAFVVKAPDSEVTEESIKEGVAKHVATYKQIQMVEFIEAIPKSASGKILRRELRGR